MKNRINMISAVRAVAILCVFGIHSVIVIGAARPGTEFPAFLYTPAWASMWILFSLSGFLLGKKFYRGECDSWRGIGHFYMSHFLRVGVPYYLFLLLSFLFINPQWFAQNGPALWMRLLFFGYNGAPGIDGVGATWFISTIVQFYIVAPFMYRYVFKKIPVKYTLYCCGGLLLAGWGLRVSLYSHVDWYKWIYTFSPMNWDLFFVPFMFNAFLQTHTHDNAFRRILRWVTPVLFVGALVICGHFIHQNVHIHSYQCVWPSIYLLLTVLLGYAYTSVDMSTAAPLTVGNICRNPLRILEPFAMVSFSFYLYHSNILSVVPKLLPPGISNQAYIWSSVLGGGGLSLAWAIVMWFFVERVCNQLRKKKRS